MNKKPVLAQQEPGSCERLRVYTKNRVENPWGVVVEQEPGSCPTRTWLLRALVVDSSGGDPPRELSSQTFARRGKPANVKLRCPRRSELPAAELASAWIPPPNSPRKRLRGEFGGGIQAEASSAAGSSDRRGHRSLTFAGFPLLANVCEESSRGGSPPELSTTSARKSQVLVGQEPGSCSTTTPHGFSTLFLVYTRKRSQEPGSC